ncbi:PLP-dependent aminotransferase family protein [Paenibacillus sp. NPDC058174]|uniref:aminotransferase-like domain-containing protein n=1 Tax=Paenibacillus sp. NPDC058174 TaxID=3346366 RepID=UPI0036D83F01
MPGAASGRRSVVDEDPAHTVLRDLFAFSGAEVVPVPVDRDGLCVDQINERTSEKAKPPKLIYVTPSHQFPVGVTMSLARRLQMLEWASAHHALIVEDDYDSEFRYEGNKQSSLAGLLPSGNVIYIGSFSKSLFPSLRLGYVVLPAYLKPAFMAVKWITDRLSPVLEQEALASFITTGKYARHVYKMSRIYAARRSCLVHALKQSFGKRVTVYGAEAGLHLMIELDTELDVQHIQRMSLAEGIQIYPATAYSV